MTHQSIKKDLELSEEDSAFAVIAAPWLPVKCYYSLYYLESVLAHLMDGFAGGFGQGGHTGVRKKIHALTEGGHFSFRVSELDRVYRLAQIESLPAIRPGQNTQRDYWQDPECTASIARKLMEYKLDDVKRRKDWNLRTNKDRLARKQFIAQERLMLVDAFFWYRLKANYRDQDYIDFENGIAEEEEVLDYVRTYAAAYNRYRSQLERGITTLSEG